MAERELRRGLPRVPGGDPWPPFGSAVGAAAVPGAFLAEAPTATTGAVDTVPGHDVLSLRAVSGVESGSRAGAAVPEGAPVPEGMGSVRRGLPRVVGGEPWPPTGAVAVRSGTQIGGRAGLPVAEDASSGAPASEEVILGDSGFVGSALGEPVLSGGEGEAESRTDDPTDASATGAGLDRRGRAAAAGLVRRGLPRRAGGDRWPPMGTAAARTTSDAVLSGQGPVSMVEPSEAAAERPVASRAPGGDPSAPLSFTRTAWAGTVPRHDPDPQAEDRHRLRPTWPQALAGLLAAAGIGVLAGAGIAFARALLALPPLQNFLHAFPGEYHPAFEPAPGFPAWVGWQHFFNAFLMVMIIRSGLRVRREKRPTVFWAPRGNPKGKISLTLWFHQALDILWVLNGVVFVVLLIVSGHWARIVPTSWEVFPNALSAGLQYVSFDWPTENGWVGYNSLQQLAYFTTVFAAAPLAAATGLRMSGLWPKRAERLSRLYPVEWARAVHFPVMVYFVAFIAVHVLLVMLTGFLRNLNHMYASQDAVTWTGFWVFLASLAVIAVGWVAARPVILAPVAKAFGAVSGR